MSELEADVQRTHASPTPARPPAKEEPKKIQDDDAWLAVEAALGGTKTTDLVKNVAALGEPHRAVVKKRLSDLQKVATGDEVLTIGVLVGAEYKLIIKTALAITTTPPSHDGLRRAIADTVDAGMIDVPTVNEIRKRFGNGPFLKALPGLAGDKFIFVGTNEGFLRWIVETTDDDVLAELMTRAGNGMMSAILNKDPKLWKWVSHVRAGTSSESLRNMADSAQGTAKQELLAKLGPTAKLDNDQREAFRKTHAPDPAAVMATGTATLAEILDAVGAAGGLSSDADRAQLVKELARLHASAGDILAATGPGSIVTPAALELLLHAKDVNAEHIASFVTRPHGIDALKTPRLLKEVRAKVPTLRMRDLVEAQSQRGTLLETEGLRRWFFESATASDLLWFTADDSKTAPAAIRFTAQRHPDWGWVRELTSAASEKQLRTLALQCNHPKTERYIHTTLLGDLKTYSDGKVDEGVAAPDRLSHGGGGTRLLDTIEQGTRADVMQRLIDLDERTRISIGNSIDSARPITQRLRATDFPRAAYLLDLSFQHTIELAPKGEAATIGSELVGYLRGRPPAEETAALGNPGLFPLVAENISTNLLVVFPSLAQPAQLAKSLGRQPKLLELLLRGSDPNAVVDLISREPVLSAARPQLDANPGLLHLVPTLKTMSKAGQAGVGRLEKATQNDDIGIQVQAIEDESNAEDAVGLEGRKFHRADKKATLVEAIDELAKTHASAVSALAVLESHRAQVPALLADGSLGEHVRTLAKLVDLPPHVALPYIGIPQLIALNNGRSWYYAYRDPTVLLHLVATRPEALAHVGGNLTSNTLGAPAWLAALPGGMALSDQEVRALDGLRPTVRNAGVLRELFLKRFGMDAPAEYDLRTVDSLYQAAARLPRAHMQQERIKHIKVSALDDAQAQWDGSTIEIDEDTKLGATTTAHGREPWYTRQELRAHYAYDDAAIKAQLDAKRLETRVEKGVEQFRMAKTDPVQKLTQAVLHEVGHAVDDMLGNKTQPVFGWAKWRAYNSGEFELWATEMGGWNRVRESDRHKIRDAWVDAMRAGVPVRDLVASDHPAVSKDYDKAGVKVVHMAIHEKFPAYYSRVVVDDRVFTANKAYFGGFYSLQADAALSSPSDFSLYAPQEYFAECYAEYYREVDGSPGSREKRGGGLPSPVKKWFDEHVDTLKYDPQRFKSTP